MHGNAYGIVTVRRIQSAGNVRDSSTQHRPFERWYPRRSEEYIRNNLLLAGPMIMSAEREAMKGDELWTMRWSSVIRGEQVYDLRSADLDCE